MPFLVIALVFLFATASTAQPVSHSGPVDASGSHGSVVNSHSSDGNTSSAAHAGQSSRVSVSDDDTTRTIAAAAFPAFSNRGDCGGPEGSAQGGAAGAFFGFSFGSGNAHDCEIRNNLATLHELVQAGFLSEAEGALLARRAVLSLTGFEGLEYVTETSGSFTVVKLREKPTKRRLSILEERELNR